MEKQFEVMVSRSDLEKMGFKKNQALMMVRECKDYLVEIEGINFFANRQIGVVPARMIEKLYHIQLVN